MLAGQHTFTASGRICKVELDQICQWIHEAWEDIPNELIKKSLCKCCIDPFAGIDDDVDVDLLYADGFEREQAEIEPQIY